jgi:hypothetical protein
MAMELFIQLFGDLLAFVYHCLDRIVIYGYLSGLSRPEQVVHFFRQIVGVPAVNKEILSQRTADYQVWVEAFARNHRLPIEWAEKGVRKEDQAGVLPRKTPRRRRDIGSRRRLLRCGKQSRHEPLSARVSTLLASPPRERVRFALDSPLEEDGFELSVPPARSTRSLDNRSPVFESNSPVDKVRAAPVTSVHR